MTAENISSPNVAPGNYRIAVAEQRFQQFVQEITVQAAFSTTVDVSLSVGDFEQRIEVTALAPLLTTDSATIGSVINQRGVSNLPIAAGRNAGQLFSLAVGVVNQGTYSRPAGMNVGSAIAVGNPILHQQFPATGDGRRGSHLLAPPTRRTGV